MKQALHLAQKIKLLVLDVDGVLTDGGIYYSDKGVELRRFDVQDGLGIKLAQEAGLKIGVISGLKSAQVSTRLDGLGVRDYFLGYKNKIPQLQIMLDKYELEWSEVAYLGDDWVDASVLLRVGLPMAVANAVPEIKQIAKWISSRPGGHGAVREAIAFILRAQNELENLWLKWSNLA